jgi:hypothetical protein
LLEICYECEHDDGGDCEEKADTLPEIEAFSIEHESKECREGDIRLADAGCDGDGDKKHAICERDPSETIDERSAEDKFFVGAQPPPIFLFFCL